MKHFLLEIVEATEAAALAASKHIGSGDKLTIDRVATEAMRERLNQIEMNARVVIGEGKKDDSYGLFNGEYIGYTEDNDWYDIAVDPVDGTTQCAKGGYEAMSVIAVGWTGSLKATDNFYMNKIAVGKEVAEYWKPGLRNELSSVVKEIRAILGKEQVTVCVLDRPRHEGLVKQLRELGCRIYFIQDCDVSGAIAAGLPESGIDLFMGIGGAPEGVIAAAAIKCLGGYFEGELVDNKTYKPTENKVYTHEELAKGDVMFAATGITNGSLLKGVRFEGKGVITHSILMETESKSVKRVESYYEI